MKIAYITTHDPSDIYAWSGSVYFIRKALIASGFQTCDIGNLQVGNRAILTCKSMFYELILSKTYLPDRDRSTLKYFAAQVDRQLESSDSGVAFSPGTIPIACTRTRKPIVFWTDATFAGMIGFYPGFGNLCKETLNAGNEMDQSALRKCRLAIYTSEWAAETALNNYDVDPSKIKIVPFGANIEREPSFEDTLQCLAAKTFDRCKLLFIGVDWYRKGGDTALKVAEALNKSGLDTELHVVGCKPPREVPDYVKVHGFVSKMTGAGRATLDRLYKTCHFLLLPSRADCYGVVFAEASSYGMPSIATNIGGIPSVVKSGVNGWLLDREAGPEEYARQIINVLFPVENYRELAMSAFYEYRRRLNWSVSGKAVADLINSCCA